jgi:hypothetical protein
MDSVLWHRSRDAGSARRAFWCAWLDREVEVDFARPQWLGQPGTVVRCSAFDPPEAVACDRRCADATYRRRWPPALPVR